MLQNLLLEEVQQNTAMIHERLIPLIRKLHEDNDDEVRTAVVSHLPSIGNIPFRKSENAM